MPKPCSTWPRALSLAAAIFGMPKARSRWSILIASTVELRHAEVVLDLAVGAVAAAAIFGMPKAGPSILSARADH